MSVHSYIENISKRYALGNQTEHTFRGDLQQLIELLVPDVAATNEPKRQACGAPDYVITRRDIPVGYIEAKDIGVDLASNTLKEQLDRYRDALDNLIFTDYLDFRLYLNGEFQMSVKIAEIQNGRIVPIPETFDQFTSLIKEFCARQGQTIKSSKRLAEMMADKAKMLAYVIKNALTSDEESQANSTLKEQMVAFKEILIHDIDPKSFADIYAQTIAYGMFAARLHDPTLDTFSRQEAAERVPKTNPFLRKLFQYVAGYDLDERIKWIVDALAEIFRAADVAAILQNFGKSTQTHDPIMHFYETFLAEYDPKLRKARGVFYTPEPVVDFIVRAVDDILKTEFNLPQGLADTSKTRVFVDQQGRKVEKEFHRVQILDPATGTGTFLAQVIKQIHKGFENQQGVWNQYVDEHLIPRLNGFELLMASYAMAHLKLDLLLTETGYKSGSGSDSPPWLGGVPEGRGGSNNQRFQIYLTNSLEEYHPDTGTLWASWLSAEANEANHIKRDTPVMVVIGNPPYSGESANKGEWIMSLMEDYKKEPGGKEKLKEKNSKFINDDYVKFIRFAQYFVEKNGDGVLAYINNHGFLDNPTFRGMRWNLLNTFDKLYIIDLHGNSKKKETCPDGSPDKNVFDIQPGVSINFFIKNGKKPKNELGSVFHFDIYGLREKKHEVLIKNSLATLDFNAVEPSAPEYFFVKKDMGDLAEYRKFIGLVDLFEEYSLGVLSKNDDVTIDFERPVLSARISDFKTKTEAQLRSQFELKDDSRDWVLQKAVADLKDNYSESNFRNIVYRPFDNRWTYFTGRTRGFFAYSQNRIMRNFADGNNYAIITGRTGDAVGSMQWNLAFITNGISDQNIFYRGGGSVLPLYLYPDDNAQQTLDGRTERTPNLNPEIVKQIAERIGLAFVSEPGAGRGPHAGIPRGVVDATGFRDADAEKNPVITIPGSDKRSTTPSAEAASTPPNQGGELESFAPIDILDYIYAVLHSPTYREKYKEFLKIDFPRVPYPKDADTFWRLVALGGELRQIHLLESPVVEQFVTGYPVDGDNIVAKPHFLSVPGTIVTGAVDTPGVESTRSEQAPVVTTPGTDTLARGDVYINETQYFSNVPETAWNFYIGGYQPAQKWLKDRKGRMLNYDDINHYQRIIVALTETDRLMKEIDKVNIID